MPITSTAQHIRRVKVVVFVGRGGIALFGITTLHIVLLLLGSTLSLLHKGFLERGRSFGLVILLLVLGHGCEPNPFLGHNFLLIAQKVVEVLLNFAFSSTRCTCSQQGLVAFALSINTI